MRIGLAEYSAPWSLDIFRGSTYLRTNSRPPLLERVPTSRWPSDSRSSPRGASTLGSIRRESDHSMRSGACSLGGAEPDGDSGPTSVLGRKMLERTHVRCYQKGSPSPLAALLGDRTYVRCAGCEPEAQGRRLARLAGWAAENVQSPAPSAGGEGQGEGVRSFC